MPLPVYLDSLFGPICLCALECSLGKKGVGGGGCQRGIFISLYIAMYILSWLVIDIGQRLHHEAVQCFEG